MWWASGSDMGCAHPDVTAQHAYVLRLVIPGQNYGKINSQAQ